MFVRDEKHLRNENIRRFYDGEKFSDHVRDHCNLTGDYRGPAHNKFISNVTQKQTILVLIVFLNFSIYDCQRFFNKLVVKKNDKASLDFILGTNEE